MRWLSLFKPGDWLTIALSLVFCGAAFPLSWRGGAAEKALVRRGGEVFAELELSQEREIQVPGPLGTTTIRVEKGRARVVSDPGPRQYCVRQGWLTRPGEIAICAPNEVSVQILGGRESYDSLAY